MYKTIYKALIDKLGDVFVYFCMESENLWREVFGKSPANNNEVDLYFAKNLHRKFPELNLPEPSVKTYQMPILINE